MNQVLVVLAMVMVSVQAAPASEPIAIVSQEIDVQPDGKFHYSYESADGTKAQQDGELKVFDAEHAGEVVKGGFEYKSDDGQLISLSYTADENGYHPQGAHLPVAPPIPEVIARALAYLATLPPPKEEKI